MNKSDFIFEKTSSKYFYEPRPFTVNLLGKGYINSDSLREGRDYSIKKPKDTFRIVALGDSWTYGLSVPMDKAWPKVLESTLNLRLISKIFKRYEVLNLGVGGYDTRYEAERYKKRGVKYGPDLVILLVTDMKRVQEKMNSIEELHRRKFSGQEFIAIRNRVLMSNSLTDIYQEQLDSLLQIRNSYKGKLVIFSESQLLTKEEKNLLAKFAKREPETYYHDLIPSPIDGSKTMMLNNGHPNIKGHQLIAKEISRYLEEQSLIPVDK